LKIYKSLLQINKWFFTTLEITVEAAKCNDG
jgi:hypothetical protein